AFQQRTDQTARALARRREAQAALQRLQAGLGPSSSGSNGNAPAASPSEVRPDDLARLERLQIQDHAALEHLRDRAGELNRALDSWEPSAAAEAAAGPEPGAPDDAPPGFADTLRLAAAARQRAKVQQARLAEQRAMLSNLHKQGVE